MVKRVRTRVRITVACALLFSVLCLLPALSVAGERPAGTALQFGIGSSFSLSDFGGATICYQRFLSKDLALRLGATIELAYDTQEETAEGTGQYDGSSSGALEEWDNKASLSCEWLVYRGSDVSLYFGGGPHVSVATKQDAYSSFSFSSDAISYRSTRYRNRSLGLGATGVVGVQWAPAAWCALHVEYRAVAAYVMEEDSEFQERTGGSDDYTRDEICTSSGVEFDSEGVRAGVSIYF